MPELEIEAIAESLRKGEYLDDQYKDRLFSQPKEYELTYAHKESRGSILAGTMGVPLQTLRRFGDPADGWGNKLVFGDNLQVLKTLFAMKERGELQNADGTPGIRVCYIDPPFATRQEFRGKQDELAYADKIMGARFVEFLRKRLILIRELLSDDGSLFIHLDERKSHYIKVILDETFGSDLLVNEIIRCFYGGGQSKRFFPRKHEVIFWYAKSKAWYSALDSIRVPYDSDYRATVFAGADTRAPGKTYEPDERGKIPEDWWIINRPYGKEIIDYPTQKPEALLERIIAASSKPGDLVLDCFVGSGTTAAVADRMGRRWIAVDSGKLAIYTTQRRLLGAGGHGFDLCTAGLYDNDLLEKLPFADFQSFCLDLFGCRPLKHTISDVLMAGTRKGAPVHFFPYDQTKAMMGRDYIDSLHERIGSKVSGSVCIVAPVSACDPGLFEDIVQRGKISYFILRVPYSVIEALHDRGFEYIEQPASEEQINQALDAYGFDFIELPDVKAHAEWTGDAFRLHIESFMRGGLDPDDFDELPDAGRGDLAMVMVDANYDGELFRISHRCFADELKATEWTVSVPLSECGKRLMVVFLDTHGNERREIITRKAASKPAPMRRTRTQTNAR